MARKFNEALYLRAASRILNKPVYLEPHHANIFFQALSARLSLGGQVDHGDLIEAPELFNEGLNAMTPEERYSYMEAEYPEWQMSPNGIAIVPVAGSLMHSGNEMASLGRTYGAITQDVREAQANSNVKGTMLVVGSNGGEVSGCNTCAEDLERIKAESDKPIWTYVDESMFSAAAWVGGVGDRVGGPSSCEAGSYGVVQAHASYQQQLKDEGVKITFIHSGDKKVQGNPYEDLSAQDLQDMQASIDKFGTLFYEAAARLSGGRMSVQDVRDTQAATFMAQDAKDIGILTDVMSKADFFDEFAEHCDSVAANKTYSIGESTMDEEEIAAMQQENKRLAKANKKLQSDAAETATAHENALKAKDDEKNALIAQQARVDEVMASDEAVGRGDQAKAFLEDDKYASFTSEDIIAELGMRQFDEGYEAPNPDDVDPAAAYGGDTAKMLSAARRGARGNAAGITGRGEGTGGQDGNTGGAPAGGKGAGADDKSKKEKYRADFPEDRAEMMEGFMKSAGIVKANLKRKSI